MADDALSKMLEPHKRDIEERVRAATRQEFIKLTIAVWLLKQLMRAR